MSMIWHVNGCDAELYWSGEALPPVHRGLAAPGAPVLHAPREPALPGRRPRALARAVPRPAPPRAGAPAAHGPGRADPRLRRLQRDGPRGPPGVEGADPA